eukprot:TRINITY_DN1846_c0_g1_i1.p1 TRINITY_DN1846_c0_g1~~TRINITY_DN1846_c0_g1_i1.p1  ORF type:complete len:371 (+),score=65.43 TRINITY_DN1846_c0_g1_i1:29-1141(+)
MDHPINNLIKESLTVILSLIKHDRETDTALQSTYSTTSKSPYSYRDRKRSASLNTYDSRLIVQAMKKLESAFRNVGITIPEEMLSPDKIGKVPDFNLESFDPVYINVVESLDGQEFLLERWVINFEDNEQRDYDVEKDVEDYAKEMTVFMRMISSFLKLLPVHQILKGPERVRVRNQHFFLEVSENNFTRVFDKKWNEKVFSMFVRDKVLKVSTFWIDNPAMLTERSFNIDMNYIKSNPIGFGTAKGNGPRDINPVRSAPTYRMNNDSAFSFGTPSSSSIKTLNGSHLSISPFRDAPQSGYEYLDFQDEDIIFTESDSVDEGVFGQMDMPECTDKSSQIFSLIENCTSTLSSIHTKQKPMKVYMDILSQF